MTYNRTLLKNLRNKLRKDKIIFYPDHNFYLSNKNNFKKMKLIPF
ncbi:hypothetical protein IFVP182_C260270 [Vibrio parahaemolyticus]